MSAVTDLVYAAARNQFDEMIDSFENDLPNTALSAPVFDFASPVSGLGSKMGIDATNKWPGETNREWGVPIEMDQTVKTRVDDLWDSLGIDLPKDILLQGMEQSLV